MADDARLYLRLVSADVRSTMEYPASFAASVATSMVLTLLELVAVTAVFSNVDELAGWTLAEVILLTGMAQTGFHICEVVVGQLDKLPDLVRTGRLDTLLLRPRPVLLQVLGQDVDTSALGKLVQSVVILVVGLVVADVAWTPAAVALLVVAVASGTVIYASVWVTTSAITFWLVDSREVSSAFTYGGRTMSTYPLGVYAPSIRAIARYVIPLAFTAYYPTLGLLGRDDPLGGPSWLAWGGPGVAVATVGAAALIWRSGVRSYRSTGA